MYISELAARINQKLADDTKTQTELIVYMDAVIDDINARLNSRFPTYTEFIRAYLYYNGPIPAPEPEPPNPEYTVPYTPDSLHQYQPTAMDLNYDLIPDKYQRSVVIVGTALKVYQADEEGNESASVFQMEYEQQLFYMIRDFSFSIPPQFQEDDQGYLGISDQDIHAPALHAPAMPFITGVYTIQNSPPCWPPKKKG